MKTLRKRAIWILLAFFLLPVLAFGVWYDRQVRQHNLDHTLIEAIKKQDTRTAIALLNDGADANAEDKPYQPKTLWGVLTELWNRSKANKTVFYRSALLIAITGYKQGSNFVLTSDNPVLVKGLLEHGASPNTWVDFASRTPLSEAIQFRRLETVRVLLEHGANPNVQSTLRFEIKMTPLMLACRQPDKNTLFYLHLLIEHGAEVNATDQQNMTALMYCNCPRTLSASTAAEPVRYLLEQGAKVSLKDRKGQTALDYARGRQETAIIPLLEAALKKEQAEQHKAGTTAK